MSRVESKPKAARVKRSPKAAKPVEPAKESAGQEIARELRELVDYIKSGADPAERYTTYRVKMTIEVVPYGGDDVKRVRDLLKLSQPVFAAILGIDVGTVQSWEQGRREPSGMARRFLEEIEASPRRRPVPSVGPASSLCDAQIRRRRGKPSGRTARRSDTRD